MSNRLGQRRFTMVTAKLAFSEKPARLSCPETAARSLPGGFEDDAKKATDDRLSVPV